MKINIEAMTGIQPKLSPNLLKDNQAQIAKNVRVERGHIHAWPLCKNIYSIPPGDYQSLFRYFDGDKNHWVYSQNDIDYVGSPVSSDSFKRLYFTGEAEPRAFANDIVGTPFDASAHFYKFGHAPPGSAITSASGYTTGSHYRAWYYTFVNRYGEETGPSPVKSISDYGSGNVTLTGFAAPVAGFGIREAAVAGRKGKIRLYRTGTSVLGAQFQFVNDTDVDNTTTFSALSIIDDVADANLGSVCPTEEYDIGIPVGIAGLVSMPSGMLAGFVDNTVYFTDVYLPSSWSSSFKISFPYSIVGLAPFGSMLFVLTTGYIYSVTGSNPAALSVDKFEGFFPCVSKRGISSSELGIVYPSYEGLILVNQNGPRNVTFDFLTEDDWNKYHPTMLHGEIWGGKYFGFYSTPQGEFGGIVFDLKNSVLTELSDYYEAIYSAESDGSFYVVSGNYIQEWGGDKFNYTYYSWKSKPFLLPYNTNLSCAKVYIDVDFFNSLVNDISSSEYLSELNSDTYATGRLGDTFAGGDAFNTFEFNGSKLFRLNILKMSSTVSLKLYADGKLRLAKNISSNRMFRLPSGFRARVIEVEISSHCPVYKIVLASSPRELN